MLDYGFFSHPLLHALPLLGALSLGSLVLYYISSTKSPFPLINAQGRFDLTGSKAKLKFVTDAKNLIRAGFEKVPIF
jgi:hypothetical protein